MAQKQALQSEGEQLDEILAELQSQQKVKEISGWETGFPNLSRALDGILPGLYLLIGPPACGKTSLAKQLLDQVAMHNGVPGIFFSFAEGKKELRLKTLARLSGLECREIRRGSAYLLHWYGVPKSQHSDPERLPPSWEKLKQSAEEARSWLELIYLIQCDRVTTLQQIEDHIHKIRASKSTDRAMVVIDDSQRLGNSQESLESRLSIIADQLQAMAVNLNAPVIAIWPDLYGRREPLPEAWADRIPQADAILVMELDVKRTEKAVEPNQAITVHIVKNRGGDRGSLAFEFVPAFSRFVEVVSS